MTLMESIEIKPGFLYVLKNTLVGGYKIGITTSPQSRWKQLAVGTKSEMIGYWQLEAYREIERHLHKLYADKRVPQSEYFDLNEDELKEVISMLTMSGVPQFIASQHIPTDLPSGPAFIYKTPPPFEPNKYANWNYFGAMAIVGFGTYLLTCIFNGFM